tara:strand:+ start:3543 stop:5699 length:2157 start_codon:yes stop_codon:yes gene_type:complete
MSIQWGDALRGFVQGGTGQLFRGKEAEALFQNDVEAGAERLITAGREAWEKSKQDDKLYRDRIQVLQILGVKNKELAVALAGQDQKSFDAMIAGFREEQAASKENLLFRNYVQAEGMPMEADPTRGPFGPSDQRVIQDLTQESIDEAVERLAGKVVPGTLDEPQENTFKNNLKEQFAKMGFAPSDYTGDLSRQRSIERAMKSRPPGVSEEEWLGFIEDNIEKGAPSDVTFRAVPFSRAAEMERETLEMKFETAGITLDKARREAEAAVKNEEFANTKLKNAGVQGERFLQLVEYYGLKGITPDSTVREYSQVYDIMSPGVIKMIEQQERNRKATAINFPFVSTRRTGLAIATAYFGAGKYGKKSIDLEGIPSFESKDKLVNDVMQSIFASADKYTQMVEDNMKANMSIADANSKARNDIQLILTKNALALTDVVTQRSGQATFLQQIDKGANQKDRLQIAVKILQDQLGLNKNLSAISFPKGSRIPEINTVLTVRGARDVAKLLLDYAKNPQATTEDLEGAAAAGLKVRGMPQEGATATPVTITMTGSEPLELPALATALSRINLGDPTSIRDILKQDTWGVDIPLEDQNIIIDAFSRSGALATEISPTGQDKFKPIIKLLKDLYAGQAQSSSESSAKSDIPRVETSKYKHDSSVLFTANMTGIKNPEQYSPEHLDLLIEAINSYQVTNAEELPISQLKELVDLLKEKGVELPLSPTQ